jgi:chaperonin GroES
LKNADPQHSRKDRQDSRHFNLCFQGKQHNFKGGYFFMIKPLGERVLVEPSEQQETTSFGIVLPDSSKEKPQEGTIIAVGSGALKDGVRVALEVKEGDRVLFSKYAGTEIKYEGKEYLIMKESDIHAILD